MTLTATPFSNWPTENEFSFCVGTPFFRMIVGHQYEIRSSVTTCFVVGSPRMIFA